MSENTKRDESADRSEQSENPKSRHREVNTLISSAVLTDEGIEQTFVSSRSLSAGRRSRTTRGTLRIYIADPRDGDPSHIERIRYELFQIDYRDGSEQKTVYSWHADKPDVYEFSGDGLVRGDDGGVQSARSEATRDIRLSRSFDPLAVLAILNVGREVGDKATVDFLREYLPPELGLQFKS